MPPALGDFSSGSEALIVGLARTGDRRAFEELVRRRQSWIRNLMRRCSGDLTLADDLAQQALLQAWHDIPRLRNPNRFDGWLKRLAINTWLQHLRKNDLLKNASEQDESHASEDHSASVGMDLDSALATLAPSVRSCVVLSYHEGMTHGEISKLMKVPVGTVKSHIRRGSQRLQEILSAYQDTPIGETP